MKNPAQRRSSPAFASSLAPHLDLHSRAYVDVAVRSPFEFDVVNLDASHGFIKGDPIQKTGGDYDADARFVGAFEFEGIVRFVGAIPQRRGYLFFIFNPNQVTPSPPSPALAGEGRAESESFRRGEGATQETRAPPPAPRRFRHRKRGSTYLLLGEAAFFCSTETAEGARLDIRRLPDGALFASRGTATLGPAEWIGLAELQSAGPLAASCSHALAIYRCEADGSLWAGPASEFFDGRFEELLPAPADAAR